MRTYIRRADGRLLLVVSEGGNYELSDANGRVELVRSRDLIEENASLYVGQGVGRYNVICTPAVTIEPSTGPISGVFYAQSADDALMQGQSKLIPVIPQHLLPYHNWCVEYLGEA